MQRQVSLLDAEKLKQALLAVAEEIDCINWRRSQQTGRQYHNIASEVRRLLE